MSYTWKSAGTFDSDSEARKYCDKIGVDFRDQKVSKHADGRIDLDVRSATFDADDRPINTRGRW